MKAVAVLLSTFCVSATTAKPDTITVTVWSSKGKCLGELNENVWDFENGGRTYVTTQVVDNGCTPVPNAAGIPLTVKNTITGNMVTLESWRGTGTCAGTPYATHSQTLGATKCVAHPSENPSGLTQGKWVSVSKNTYRDDDILADAFKDDKCTKRHNNAFVLHAFATNFGCNSVYDSTFQSHWSPGYFSQNVVSNGANLDFSLWIGSSMCTGTATASILNYAPGTCEPLAPGSPAAALLCGGATTAGTCYVKTYDVGMYAPDISATVALLLLICCCLMPLFIICGCCATCCGVGGIVGITICCICKKKKAAAEKSAVAPAPTAQPQQIVVVASQPVEAPIVATATVVVA